MDRVVSDKTCFVISPIGAQNSETREHADDVFDYIIKPACEAVGFAPRRADHDTRPGIITEQMYDCILNDDLLIAVLTYHNPNVFYEVAIAEAAARPLVLMIAEDTPIPFDINDRRLLIYDLKPRSVMTGVHKDHLIEAIKELRIGSSGADRHVPFRPGLSPLGAERTASRVFRRTNELPPEERIRLIAEATEFLKVRGLAFFKVAMKDHFLDAIKEAVDRGLKIQVLLMDPENPVLEYQLRDLSSNYVETVKGEIISGIEMWLRALGSAGEIRLQSKGFMTGAAQINENEALLTRYSNATSTADSPCMSVRSDEPHYTQDRVEFDFVWSSLSRAVDDPA